MKLEWAKRIYTEITVKKRITELRSKSNLPIVVFVCTPIHGNLGDQAIVYAQYKFFDDLGLGNRILEITDPDYYRLKDILHNLLDEKDIIVIDGGGNIGTLWPREDKIIREIIDIFVKNKIYIFPQTVCYSNDSNGVKTRQQLKTTLDRAKNVTIFCRDNATYEIVKNEFNATAYLVPDIVMTLKDIHFDLEKKNTVLLCMRKDREICNYDDGKKNLFQYLEKSNIPIKYSSTVIDVNCRGNKKRETILFDKWREFSSAKIIITDRLHGMIFAAILGVPCIAFDNKSHKVVNGYSWLAELPYIKIIENKNQAINIFDSLYQSHEKYVYINEKVEIETAKMKEIVKNEIG